MSMPVLRYVLGRTKSLFVLTLFSVNKELYVIGDLNSFNPTPLSLPAKRNWTCSIYQYKNGLSPLFLVLIKLICLAEHGQNSTLLLTVIISAHYIHIHTYFPCLYAWHFSIRATAP